MVSLIQSFTKTVDAHPSTFASTMGFVGVSAICFGSLAALKIIPGVNCLAIAYNIGFGSSFVVLAIEHYALHRR